MNPLFKYTNTKMKVPIRVAIMLKKYGDATNKNLSYSS